MVRIVGIARLRDSRPYKERGDDYILAPFDIEIEGDYEEEDIQSAIVTAAGKDKKGEPYVWFSWKAKPTEMRGASS